MTNLDTETAADPDLARQTMRALLDGVHALQKALSPPAAPDQQVRDWPLYTGDEYGGVYCAEPECGCAAEQSEIIPGGWASADDDDPSGRFTIATLREAVAEHIAHRAELRAEEAEGQR
jgi:hypothetical protein